MIVAFYKQKEFLVPVHFQQHFLRLSEGEDRIDVSEYVPNPVEDVKTVCVGSFNTYTENRKLSEQQLEAYHFTHSKVVALLREKQATLRELNKEFSEISFVETPSDTGISCFHEWYSKMTDLLWVQRFETPAVDVASLDFEALPIINKTMIEAIAVRHICAAGVKYLLEVEKYYEKVFESRKDDILHFRCYKCYLPDLGICAVYSEDGAFIDFVMATDNDVQSLNSNMFAGYRSEHEVYKELKEFADTFSIELTEKQENDA